MNSAVVRFVAILGVLMTALLVACGSSGEGRPDDELGGLVIAPDTDPPSIDVDKAASDPKALAAALATEHQRVYELLGPHQFKGTSKVEVTEGGAVVETLSDTTEIAILGNGNYRAILDNSRDYGRHAIFVDGTLYLRPRFGKYHRRAPTGPAEPAQIRNEIFATLGAYFEPLAARAELTDTGATTVGKRPARRIQIKSAPQPGKAPAQELKHKKWREDAVAQSVEGEVVLDAETGVALEAKLTGALGFARKGKSFTMKLEVTHAITLGAPEPIAAPADEDSVATYVRLKEQDERDTLLKGIAPPAKKPPTPSNTDSDSEQK